MVLSEGEEDRAVSDKSSAPTDSHSKRQGFQFVQILSNEELPMRNTVCPRSLDLFHTVRYYINFARTSWTYCMWVCRLSLI